MRFFWCGLRKTSPPVKNSKTSKRIPKRVRPQRSYRGTGGPPGSHRYGHYTHAPGAAPDRRLEPPTAPPARRRGLFLTVRAPISEISKQSLDRPPPRSPHRWKYRRRAAGEGGGGGGDTIPARPWLGRPRATSDTSDVGLRRLPRATKDGVKTAYISLSTCKEYVSSAAPCGPQSRSYMPPAGTRHQHMCTLVGCPSATLGSRSRGSLHPHNPHHTLRIGLERKENPYAQGRPTYHSTVTVSPLGRKRTQYVPSSRHAPSPPLDRGL